MLNRFMFILGLVISITCTLAVAKFIRNDPQRLYAISLALPKETPKTGAAFAYTAADVRCLQENIFFEARNQSEEGRQMVGIVTIERVLDRHRSVCEVIHQHAQFSWTLKRHRIDLKNKLEANAWIECGVVAESVLANTSSIDTVYNNLVYYHKSTVHPKWADSVTLRREFVVDDHVFYSKVNRNETLSLVLR